MGTITKIESVVEDISLAEYILLKTPEQVTKFREKTAKKVGTKMLTVKQYNNIKKKILIKMILKKYI